MGKKRRRTRRSCNAGSHYDSARPARPATPTEALPGSEAKIEELARRYARRQCLHAPGDLVDHEAMRVRLAQSKNGQYYADRDHEEGDVIDERSPEQKISQKIRTGSIRKLCGTTPGDRIRAARLKQGLSTRELSRRLGLSRSHISQVERREVAPTLMLLANVARVLSVRIDYLACITVDASGTVRCLCA